MICGPIQTLPAPRCASTIRVLLSLPAIRSRGIGGTRLALQWQHLPSVEDSAEPLTPNSTTGAPAYNIFNINGSFSVGENTTVRFGIDNLFNEAPPRTEVDLDADPALGQLGGGSYNSTFYDTNGRRFYLGASVRF